ncbi:MAG: hypothetical protein EOP48_25055 [Sphingobacteriales bacterium]|nr:MAG: hypothetical protein EOP48_25055 [Sphingobacteriales bacterium]
MFDSQSKSSMSLNINFGLPEKVKNEFPKYPLPGRFERYEETSSFILNYWEGLWTLALLLLVISIATFMAPKTKGCKYVHLIFYHIENITKWDLLLMLLCMNIDGIGIYSSLELRNIHLNVPLSILGMFVCIGMNLVIIHLLGKALYMFIDLHKSRRSRVIPFNDQDPTTNPQQENKKWSQYKILYQSFKEGSFLQQSFMLFFLLRIYVFDMIIGYFFAYPLVQAILITTLSIVLITYLAVKRPYKRTLDLIKLLINESIIALVNINVLILAIMDKRGQKSEQARAIFGDIIIYANVAFNILAVAFIVAEVIIKVITVYKIMKSSKAKGRSFWMKAFLSLFVPSSQTDCPSGMNAVPIASVTIPSHPPS